MATTNINVETSVSTTIRLDAVSLETYFRILDFIERETGKRTPVYPKTEERDNGGSGAEESAEKESAGSCPPDGTDKPEQKTVVPIPVYHIGKTEESEGSDPEKAVFDAKWDAVSQYQGYEKVRSAFTDAYEHPENWTWEYLKSEEWKEKFPELSDVPALSISHMLGNMVKVGFTDRQRKCPGTVSRYRVPVPTAVKPAEAEEPTVNLRDKRLGDMLRKARMDRDMSIADVANGVGCIAPLIMKYETGVYTMSELMKRELCKFFHADIFAGIKEAAV